MGQFNLYLSDTKCNKISYEEIYKVKLQTDFIAYVYPWVQCSSLSVKVSFKKSHKWHKSLLNFHFWEVDS